MTPAAQLSEIGERLRPMLKKQVAYLREKVMPALSEAGVTVEPYKN